MAKVSDFGSWRRGFLVCRDQTGDAQLYPAEIAHDHDQPILFKALDEKGEAIARYALIDLGFGTVDHITVASPAVIESKGPNPIEFENGYVAFEDLPEDKRRLPGMPSGKGAAEKDDEEDDLRRGRRIVSPYLHIY